MFRIAVLAAALCTAALLPSTASAQEPATVSAVIHAGRLLADPSTGRVQTEQSILIGADGHIVGIEAGYVTPPGAHIIDQRNRFVLPGLIDSHVHLTNELGPDQLMDPVTRTPADYALTAAYNARKTLNAGFTTVADLGVPDGDNGDSILALRDAVNRGIAVGPRIIASGSQVGPHGGHNDINGYRQDINALLRNPYSCSGPDECRRAVRLAVQRGVDIIKITATGGVMSNTAAGINQQLADDELRAIVQTAHAMGRRVTAHAHGLDGINAALRAGVDSIEHGTFSDAESFRLLRQGNRYLVPTLMAGWWISQLAERGEILTPAQAAKARVVGPQVMQMARRAHAAHVRIAFGTDTGVSPHGMNAREFQLLVEAGFSPLESIQFATVAAADHLQISNVAGRIAPGLSADIIAVDGDPLADVATLMNVPFVMARGAVFKE